MTAPKRRWFRYSLRTLFVMVTMVCCWLGYGLHWIQLRRDWTDEENKLRRNAGREEIATVARTTWWPPTAPILLWGLAEPGVEELNILVPFPQNHPDREFTAEENAELARGVGRARQLFPEASQWSYGPVWDIR